MCQEAVRRLCNPSESCHVRKVARLLAQALSSLPVVVFLIAEFHEQVPRLFFEDPPVLLGEDVFPIPGYAFTERGGGVFLSPLSATGETLEADLLDAPAHRIVARLCSQEYQQPLQFLRRVCQQALVFDLGVVVAQEFRPVFRGAADGLAPQPSPPAELRLVEHPYLRDFLGAAEVGVSALYLCGL